MPIDKALSKLSYEDEKQVLRNALELPATSTLLVVRHGKAMLRKHWNGDDWHRPLSSRGRRQSRRMVGLLTAYGTTRLVSSTSTRCMQTLIPKARASAMPIAGVSLLSEEEAEGKSREVQDFVAELCRETARKNEVVAVCGHRPVLPDMRAGAGVKDAAMLTGEVLVVHLDDKGRAVATETHKSSA